jgi:hydroxypyruvate isomerase
MPRFSANLGFLWSDRPLLDRVAAAAAAGFKAVEFHWPYDIPAEDIRRACDDHDLAVIGLNTPRGDAAKGEFGLGAAPGREGEFQSGFDLAVSYAQALGAKSVHVMAGVVSPASRPAATDAFIANLDAAARKASGLTLLLEALNPRDVPGYLCSRQEEAASIIARVGAANIRLMFDVYHVGVAEGDILRKLEKHMPMIGHVQIAAVPSRAEPDEGEIAYPAIFAALDRMNYEGWIGCEYRPRGDVSDGLAWTRRLGVSL